MKKGFTLVELLSVIVIISVISMITIPMVTKYINSTKDRLYETQVKDIIAAAEKWALNNTDKIDKYHINDTVITVTILQHLNYLEKDDILNPKTKEVMNGYVLIKYDSATKGYHYEYYQIYLDESSNPTIDDELSDSYVMYCYNFESEDNAAIDPLLEIRNNSNTPFYLDILKNNQLHVVGETADGLYETENEYIFKGNSVNNYVKYGGNVWRILSVDKSDYSMKLVSISLNDSNTWSNVNEKTVDFKKSNFQTGETTLLKVIDNWYNGKIENQVNSITGLLNNLKLNTDNSKEAIISIYDYVSSSTSNECDDNFLSQQCKTNNYLSSMYNGKSVWTMNNDGTQIWYITSDGNLALADSTAGPYYYSKVIKLPINIYATNIATATGSETQFAYEIK